MIRTVYRKELLDIVRDRRTLIAMVLLPVVLYPALIIGMAQLTQLQEQRQMAEDLEIGVANEGDKQWLEEIVGRVDQAREERAEQLRASGEDADANEPEEGRLIPTIISDLGGAVEREEVPVSVARMLAPPVEGRPQTTVVRIAVNAGSDRSRQAADRLRRLLFEYRTAVVKTFLADSGLDSSLAFEVAVDNRADRESEVRWFLAKITPLILILMTITGGAYPAIDLTAGERERGTLETLMVCPVPTSSLIIGKFLVVTSVAMLAATLNLASIGATIQFMGVEALVQTPEPMDPFSTDSSESAMGESDSPEPEADASRGGASLFLICGTILITLVPFAVFSSAVLIAVCSFARTFKECQNYVTPVILACLVPCFVAVLPGSRLAGPMLVVPVANMALLTRELLLGHFDYAAIATVLLSTSLYAAAAVALATRLFGQEAVVFSDSASWRSVLDRRLMRPRSLPTGTQALVLTALLFPANFYIQASLAPLGAEDPVRQLVLVGITILALMGVVPLGTAAYFKLNLANTFRLRVPPLRFWLAGVLVGLSGWVVAHEIVAVQSQFLELPKALVEQGEKLGRTLEQMRPETVLFILAVIPGVCEELFFRGFLLSTLSATQRRWSAILTVAVVFAFFHMSIWRIGVPLVLGVFFGLLCWQSRSVLPGLLGHAMHNALVVGLQLFPKARETIGLGGHSMEGHLPVHYLVGAAVALAVAFVLVRKRAEPVIGDGSLPTPDERAAGFVVHGAPPDENPDSGP